MGRPERRQWFRLARQLGMSVARAQREISSLEFAEWMAYDITDPGDPERSDVRAAQICATFANTMRSKGRAFQIKDFLLKFGPPVKKSMQEIKMKLMAWKSMHDAARKK